MAEDTENHTNLAMRGGAGGGGGGANPDNVAAGGATDARCGERGREGGYT